ncbi:MAG: glycosyltransferase family 4 protein [Actinomycetota bacterium]
MTNDRALRFLAPEGLDDPLRVSGGNVYDRHLRDGLARRGWAIQITEVSDDQSVAAALAAMPRGAITLVDGMVAAWAPAAVEAAAGRLTVVIIAHMVMAAFSEVASNAIRAEGRALRAASRIIVTSEWTGMEVARRYLVDPAAVAVAVPGSLDGDTATREADHRELLCVGVISAHKGQDVLLRALAALPDDGWTCTLAGSLTTDPEFAKRVAEQAEPFGEQIRMPGVLNSTELDAAYSRAGLLVAPSRTESYSMAIADARRRGLPVIATDVGGIPEAVAEGGAMLVRRGDVDGFSSALHRWMSEPALRDTLRSGALRGRSTAPRWADTIDVIHETLVRL